MLTRYMHLVRCTEFMPFEPAGFKASAKWICFAWRGMPLAKSLRQIKREQQTAMRNGQTDVEYSYLRVLVPEDGE